MRDKTGLNTVVVLGWLFKIKNEIGEVERHKAGVCTSLYDSKYDSVRIFVSWRWLWL